jgi:hypothetical protein
MLLGQASFALFGGSNGFQIFIKIMSRVMPMVLGPARILDAFIIRHIVIVREEEKKTKKKTEKHAEEKTVAKTEDEKAVANHDIIQRTTVAGAAVVPLDMDGSAASLVLPQSSSSNTHDDNNSTESFIKRSKKKLAQAVRSRHSSARRDYYILVPRWAVAMYCVPVFILCTVVFIRLATWPDCAAGSDVCLARSYPIFRGYANEGCACNVIMFDQTGIRNGSCAEGTRDAALERQLQATVASASHVYMAVFSVNFQCPRVAETVAKAWDKFDSIRVFIFLESFEKDTQTIAGRKTVPPNILYYNEGIARLRATLQTIKSWTNLCTFEADTLSYSITRTLM